MTDAIAFERFLARLYTDARMRAIFLRDPLGAARRAGFSEGDARALSEIDRDGLVLTAQSLARKRSPHHGVARRFARSLWRGWNRLLGANA